MWHGAEQCDAAIQLSIPLCLFCLYSLVKNSSKTCDNSFESIVHYLPSHYQPRKGTLFVDICLPFSINLSYPLSQHSVMYSIFTVNLYNLPVSFGCFNIHYIQNQITVWEFYSLQFHRFFFFDSVNNHNKHKTQSTHQSRANELGKSECMHTQYCWSGIRTKLETLLIFRTRLVMLFVIFIIIEVIKVIELQYHTCNNM